MKIIEESLHECLLGKRAGRRYSCPALLSERLNTWSVGLE